MKFIADRRALETLEWVMVGAGVAVVAYVAYQYLGESIANFVRSLAGMF